MLTASKRAALKVAGLDASQIALVERIEKGTSPASYTVAFGRFDRKDGKPGAPYFEIAGHGLKWGSYRITEARLKGFLSGLFRILRLVEEHGIVLDLDANGETVVEVLKRASTPAADADEGEPVEEETSTPLLVER